MHQGGSRSQSQRAGGRCSAPARMKTGGNPEIDTFRDTTHPRSGVSGRASGSSVVHLPLVEYTTIPHHQQSWKSQVECVHSHDFNSLHHGHTTDLYCHWRRHCRTVDSRHAYAPWVQSDDPGESQKCRGPDGHASCRRAIFRLWHPVPVRAKRAIPFHARRVATRGPHSRVAS